MQIVNLPKLILACVFMVCVCVLLITNHLDETVGASLLTFIAGYIFGNGVAAYRGQPVQPIVGAQQPSSGAFMDGTQ
jgi:hypothetical protein